MAYLPYLFRPSRRDDTWRTRRDAALARVQERTIMTSVRRPSSPEDDTTPPRDCVRISPSFGGCDALTVWSAAGALVYEARMPREWITVEEAARVLALARSHEAPVAPTPPMGPRLVR